MMLLACGIDSEKISRFSSAASDTGHPFPFVFSSSEISHCRGLDNPSLGLCASFCCKEAVRKALARPYNYPDCEAFFDEHALSIVVRPTEAFLTDFGIDEIRSEVRHNPLDPDEMVVVVSVLGQFTPFFPLSSVKSGGFENGSTMVEKKGQKTFS
jgi:phosphopantetheinyl transferase (holo-ACP synthase)